MLRPLRRLLTRLRCPRASVVACFLDELTPGDERLLRALLAEQEARG